MQCKLEATHDLSDPAAKDATGKTLKQWFSDLDGWDALKLGRRKTYVRLAHEMKVDDWWATTIAVEYEKNRDQVKKDGLYEGYGICATRTIAAPVADVYAKWTDSASLSQWFGKGTKAAVVDGGKFSTKDGDKGEYLRVRPNKDLRFTWEHPGCFARTLVDVTFEDKGNGKTLLMANHSRIQNRAEADGLRVGWSEALDKLKKICEK